MSLGIMAQTLSTWIFTFTVPYMYNVDSGNLGAQALSLREPQFCSSGEL
jgi:hypothetical protein